MKELHPRWALRLNRAVKYCFTGKAYLSPLKPDKEKTFKFLREILLNKMKEIER